MLVDQGLWPTPLAGQGATKVQPSPWPVTQDGQAKLVESKRPCFTFTGYHNTCNMTIYALFISCSRIVASNAEM